MAEIVVVWFLPFLRGSSSKGTCTAGILKEEARPSGLGAGVVVRRSWVQIRLSDHLSLRYSLVQIVGHTCKLS